MSINFVVRFADNVSELKAHLREGLDQIETTRAAVDKLSRSLGGENVIRSAHNWTAALQEIGGAGGTLAGVQKLTAAETDRANAAIDRAVDKYKALGQAIPTPISELQKLLNAEVAATKSATDAAAAQAKAAQAIKDSAASYGVLGSAFGQVVAAFSAASLLNKAVGAITDLAQEALRTAGTLVDLSNKTGLSTETLQRMQFVAKQSGSDMATFADAAFKMGVNVSEGTAKARGGAEALGLNWQALRAASPDAQFDMVVRALEKMEDPQKRNAAAVALFGKTAKEILPAIVDGYTKVAQGATVAGDAQVHALDAAGDAWDRWKARTTSSFVQAAGSMLLLHDATKILTQDEKDFILQTLEGEKSIERYDAALIKAAESKRKLGNIPGPGKPGVDIALPPEVKPPAPTSFGDDLKKAEAGYRALTAAKKDDIAAGLQLGATNDQIINQENITEGVLSIAKKAFEEHKSALAKAAEAQKKYAEAQAEYASAADGAVGATATYESVLDKVGNELYEGVAADHARGISTEVLAETYRTTKTVIDQIIKSEAGLAKQLEDTTTRMGDSREEAVAAGAAITKAFAGQPDLLKNLLISTGAVPISLKSILTPAQELGHVLTDVTVSAKEHFDDLSDTITGDVTDIVRTMRELGVHTRTDLEITAREFKAQYDTMLASGKFTVDELRAAWIRYRQAVTAAHPELVVAFEDMARFAGAVNTFNSALAPIANLSPAFASVHTAVDGVTRGMEGIAKAQADISANGLNVSNLADLAKGWAGVATAAVGYFFELVKIGEAQRGAELSAAFVESLRTSYATADQFTTQFAQMSENSFRRVGLAFDQMSARIRAGGDLSEADTKFAAFFQKLTDRALAVKAKYGDHVPKEEIFKLLAAGAGFVQLYSDALMVGDAIKELGGVARMSATEIAAAQDKVRLLLDLIPLGGTLGSDAIDAMDTSLMAFGDAAVHSGGLVDQFFLDMAAKAKAAGTELKKVAEFQSSQAKDAETGIVGALTITNDAWAKRKTLQDQVAQATTDLAGKSGSALADQQAKLADLNTQLLTQQHIIDATGIHSQAAAGAVSGALLGVISSQVAAGTSFGDAIRSVAPGIDSLKNQLNAMGIGGGDAFDFLNQQVGLFTGEVTGPALQSIEGYAQGLVGLHNAGQLNQDTFAGITEQIGKTEQALEAQGVSGPALLTAMQSPLQKIWELEDKFGYKADAATQALVDQALAAGEVGEAQKSVADQMLDATTRIADAVEGLAEVFGVLPKAASDAADGINSGLGRVQVPTLPPIVPGVGGLPTGAPSPGGTPTTVTGPTASALTATAGTMHLDVVVDPTGMAQLKIQADEAMAGLKKDLTDLPTDAASTAALAKALTEIQIQAGASLDGLKTDLTTLPADAKTATDGLAGQIADLQIGAGDAMDGLADALKMKAGDSLEGLKQDLTTLPDEATDAMGGIRNPLHDLTIVADESFDGLKDDVTGLPKDAKTAADGISDELAKIKIPTITIPIVPSGSFVNGVWTPTDVVYTNRLPGFATGSGGIRDFGLGTNVTLHGREAVFTEDQLTAPSSVTSTHATPPTANPPVGDTYHIAITGFNGTDILRTVRSPEFVEALVSATAQNKNGMGTGMRAALQVDR